MNWLQDKDEVHETLALPQGSKEHRKLGGFNLTKWSSNSPEVMRAIPEEDRASESLEDDSQEVNSIIGALGLHWYPRLS